MNCVNCQKETTNPKFCSRSCAGIYNNAIQPKRPYSKKSLSNKCRSCNAPILARHIHCSKCRVSIPGTKGVYPIETKTLQECIDSVGKTANRYRSIRDSARNKLIALKIPTCCNNCNYDKHVEVCHIKSISSFPLDTKIAEINNISNLIYLCPNCHWEFDNSLLDINLVCATVTQLVE